MQYKKARAFLFTMLFTSSLSVLHAQDAGIVTGELIEPGLMTDGMPGIGNLLPVEDLLSTEEILSTESGPAPGDIPVDGGLSLLLAAGAAYGAGRMRRRTKADDDRKN